MWIGWLPSCGFSSPLHQTRTFSELKKQSLFPFSSSSVLNPEIQHHQFLLSSNVWFIWCFVVVQYKRMETCKEPVIEHLSDLIVKNCQTVLQQWCTSWDEPRDLFSLPHVPHIVLSSPPHIKLLPTFLLHEISPQLGCLKLQWHLNDPVLYTFSFKVLSNKMAAKSLEVYAVRTITFDHTTGVQLMRRSMQLAAECLQVPWWEVRDANSEPAHQAHQPASLGQRKQACWSIWVSLHP